MWKFVCLNIYKNNVEENEFGIRRYRVDAGWIIENEKNTGISFGRYSGKNILNFNSLIFNILDISLENDMNKIYKIIFAKMGDLTSDVKINEELYKKFEYQFNYIKKNYLLTKLYNSKIKIFDKNSWNWLIKQENKTNFVSVQLFLSKLILKFKNHKWLEMGLIENIDSSTWVLSDLERKIFSSRVLYDIDTPNSSKSPFLSIDILKKIKNFKDYSFILYINEQNKENMKHIINYAKNKNIATIICYDDNLCDFINNCDLYDINISKCFFYGKKILNICFFNIKSGEKIYNLERELKLKYFEKTFNLPSLQEIDESGKVSYRTISEVSEPTGVLSQRLEYNTYQALLNVKKEKLKIDNFVAKKLKIPLEQLSNSLSCEQVDMIPLALNAFKKNEGFLLGDETGFGKGRALSSLVLIALKEKKLVLFITEKSSLFSDFFRDLNDVDKEYSKTINPIILNSKKTIIYDINNNEIAKSYTKKHYDAMLDSNDIPKDKSLFIMTSYSQLNKVNDDKNKKMKWLLNVLSKYPSIIVEDEAHNASGNSNINSNIEELSELANAIVYSSATYSKNEKNLNAYKRAIPLQKWIFNLVERSLLSGQYETREILTNIMAKNGNFIRREHKPLDPPEQIIIPINKNISNDLELFSKIWRNIFEVFNIYLEITKIKTFGVWDKVGSVLSRTIKEYHLLAKVNYIPDEVEKTLNENKKAVLFIEKTFEGALKTVLLDKYGVDKKIEKNNTEIKNKNKLKHGDTLDENNEENIEEEFKRVLENLSSIEMNALPLWKEKLIIILDGIIDLNILDTLKNISKEDKEMLVKRRNMIADLINKMPNWDLFPFETIKNNLAKKNIELGELSGRLYSYKKLDNGKYKIILREKEDRNIIINKFNSGKIHALLITIAACTGNSLHASAKFSDQSVRKFYEVDIAVNPSNRVQAYGRVNRKDQVVLPEMGILMFDTLSEKRIVEREGIKRDKLYAHAGNIIENKLTYLSKEGEDITNEWCLENKEMAKILGINSTSDSDIGKVDRMLIRSIILNEEDKNNYLNKLDNGLLLLNDIHYYENNKKPFQVEKISSQWLFGYPNYHNVSEPLFYPTLNLVERTIFNEIKKDHKQITNIFNKKHIDAEFHLNKVRNFLKNCIVLNFNMKKINNWVNNFLGKINIGTTITFTEPYYGSKAFAIIKDVVFSDNALKNSYFSLSQFALKLFVVDYKNEINVPFSYLFKDDVFSVLNKNIELDSFLLPSANKNIVSVEGNPILTAIWGEGWKIGKNTLIKEVGRENVDWIWMLPQKYDMEFVKKLDRDLINYNHAKMFMENFGSGIMYGAVPIGNKFIIEFDKDNMFIQLDYDTYKSSQDKWINYKSVKLMNSPPVFNKGIFEITINKQYNIANILYIMQNFGVGFRISKSFDNWYIDSSKELMGKLVKNNTDMVNKISRGKVIERKR